jgi:hypothetical protein
MPAQAGLHRVLNHVVVLKQRVGHPFTSSTLRQPCSPALRLLPLASCNVPPYQIHSWLAWIHPPLVLSLVPSAPTNTDFFRKSAKPVDSRNADVPCLCSFSMVSGAKSSSRAAEAYMFGDVLCEDLISTFLVSIQSLLSYLAS